MEKLSYELGLADELRHYDPTNDWDTHDEAFTIVTNPHAVGSMEPTICVDVDDGNVRARNRKAEERRALTRHVGDEDNWGFSTKEEIPLLGVNEGPRKACTKCKKPKGFMLFSPDARNADGLHSWCKGCRKEFTSQKRRK